MASKDFLGICQGCGQTKMVKAESQAEADKIATNECDCPEGELQRRKKEFDDRLNELIGETAPDNGWEPAKSKEIFDRIQELGYVVIEGGIESAVIRIDKTTLKIKGGGKLTLERSKTIRQGGTIDK